MWKQWRHTCMHAWRSKNRSFKTANIHTINESDCLSKQYLTPEMKIYYSKSNQHLSHCFFILVEWFRLTQHVVIASRVAYRWLSDHYLSKRRHSSRFVHNFRHALLPTTLFDSDTRRWTNSLWVRKEVAVLREQSLRKRNVRHQNDLLLTPKIQRFVLFAFSRHWAYFYSSRQVVMIW